ncbi:serine hydrolase domain-containing protein [Microlunatus ginsengisoli]|uniref:Beta-lactamase-related domain-containing protein n=1 Tax=Microlunatus ginsengisoli TaxID=363863 RepID=A0ABP7A5X4_9ACTN
MATDDLPHSTPSAEGVDPAGLEAFLDAIEDAPQIDLHGLVALRHGRVIAEGWWSPYSADRVHLLYSLSKSFTSTAAGLAVAEGLLDLDATVLSYFPELDGEITDPRSRAMKVRHIAAMASGHATETLDRARRADPTNLVRGFLLTPPDQDPGTVFAYNQPCTYTLAAIVQRRSGQSLIDYLRPRLFDPLGIEQALWIEEPPGQDIGFSGLHATTDAIARLGQLYLQRGRWRDRQLLDPAWVDEATSKQVDNPAEENPDWRQGYGFQFWMARHGYRGDGAFGQFCIVLPEVDVVLALTAATEDMQGILDAVWEHVLPAIDAAAPDHDADRRLADRLAAAALPPLSAKAEPDDRQVWDGATFLPGPDAQTEDSPLGQIGIRLTRAGLRHDDSGWLLSITDTGGTLEVPVGSDGWAVDDASGVPVAVSGGWSDPDTFVADVIFLETPHKVRLVCSGPERTLAPLWRTVALHPTSVVQLRGPRPTSAR